LRSNAEIRRRTARLVTALLLVGSAAGADAASARRGTSSAAFLRFSRSAREAALADTHAGATGAAAVGVQPAALGETPGVLFTRNEAAGGAIHVDDVSAAQRWSRGRSAGFSLLHASAGPVDQTDDTGSSVGDFTPRDIAATLGGAWDRSQVSLGASLTYLSSKLVHTAHAVTAGAGLKWRAPDGRTAVSLTGDNLAGRLRFVDESAPLPRAVRLGVDERWGRWSTVAEIVSPNDDALYAAGGAEVTLGAAPWRFALRAGLNQARAGRGGGGVSAGAGLAGDSWTLDYAWAPGGDLGDDHLFTFGWRLRPPDMSQPETPTR
jgi:hypothetical protein